MVQFLPPQFLFSICSFFYLLFFQLFPFLFLFFLIFFPEFSFLLFFFPFHTFYLLSFFPYYLLLSNFSFHHFSIAFFLLSFFPFFLLFSIYPFFFLLPILSSINPSVFISLFPSFSPLQSGIHFWEDTVVISLSLFYHNS